MGAMRLTGVDIAVIAGAGGLVLLVLAWTVATRVATGRRIRAIALRLGADAHEGVGRGIERKLVRLEHTAEDAMARVGDAGVTADRLARALDAVGEGVVVCDEEGGVVFQNTAARAIVTPGLAERAVDELLEQATAGISAQKTVELVGPPPRTLLVA